MKQLAAADPVMWSLWRRFSVTVWMIETGTASGGTDPESAAA